MVRLTDVERAQLKLRLSSEHDKLALDREAWAEIERRRLWWRLRDLAVRKRRR